MGVRLPERPGEHPAAAAAGSFETDDVFSRLAQAGLQAGWSRACRRRQARREFSFRVRPASRKCPMRSSAADPHRCNSGSPSRFVRRAQHSEAVVVEQGAAGEAGTPGPSFEIEYVFIGKEAWRRPGATTLVRAIHSLPGTRPVGAMVFRLNSQPLQESLVCGWVAGFERALCHRCICASSGRSPGTWRPIHLRSHGSS